MNALRRLLAALLVAVAACSLAPAAAHAEDGYRYWSFWQYANGAWDYAQKGPDGIVPTDGSTHGWRFASAGMNDRRVPRAAGDFQAICGATPAEEGKKRVAVVLDQGTAADAPNPAADRPNGQVQGTCVVARPEANAAEVLGMVAPVRTEKGKTCGIGGYPAAACTEPVRIDKPATDEQLPLTVQAPKGSTKASATPAPAPEDKGGSNLMLWLLPLALMALLIFGGMGMRNRRTRDSEPAVTEPTRGAHAAGDSARTERVADEPASGAHRATGADD